jgi:CheY-like chemotaxis protein
VHDEDILEFAAEILKTLGYDVVTALNGLEASALLRKNPDLHSDYRYPHARHGGRGAAEISSGITASNSIQAIFTSGSTRPHAVHLFSRSPTKPLTWYECCRHSMYN